LYKEAANGNNQTKENRQDKTHHGENNDGFAVFANFSDHVCLFLDLLSSGSFW